MPIKLLNFIAQEGCVIMLPIISGDHPVLVRFFIYFICYGKDSISIEIKAQRHDAVGHGKSRRLALPCDFRTIS